MGSTIDASGIFIEKCQKNSTHRTAGNDITMLASQSNERVWELLNTSVTSIVTVSETDFSLLLRDYFIYSLQRHHLDLTEDVYIACTYLEQLILDLVFMHERGRDIVKNPYVIDRLEKKEYKTAGDVAIFGYLFFHHFRKNELNKDDYLAYIIGSYSAWYIKRTSFNTGHILAGKVPKVLPLIENMNTDMFRRSLQSV